MPELADLFAPVAWPHFVAHHLDRDWLHLPPGPGCDRAALFDFDRFDRLLSRPAIRAENLFAIDARRKLGPADYARADGTSDVLAVLDLFDSGATVVFRHADRHDSVLWRLTRRFEAALGAPAFANVYYAPAGGQSFPTHHDALDVYAVQCAGTKTWCFHRRIDPLPLAHEHSYGEADDYGPALAEAALNPGDLLYVPRGLPHRVVAGSEPSLHVSISVTAFTRHDALRARHDALRARIEAMAAAPGPHRATLPATPGPDDTLAGWADAEDFDIAAWQRAALMQQVPVAIDRPLAARRGAAGLDAETRLVAKVPGPWFIEPMGDHLRLLGNGRALGFVAGAGAALARALSGEAFAAGALPGLDQDTAIELSAALRTNGFVNAA